MIDIMGLTTSQQVRAVMGVDPTDLSDVMFESMSLEDDLAEELYTWLPEWDVVLGAGTDRQQRLLRLYAKYKVGAFAAAAAQNFLIVKKSDGANVGELADMDLDTFNAMTNNLNGRAYKYQVDLLEDLAGLEVAVTYPLLFGVAVPDRDPNLTGRS